MESPSTAKKTTVGIKCAQGLIWEIIDGLASINPIYTTSSSHHQTLFCIKGSNKENFCQITGDIGSFSIHWIGGWVLESKHVPIWFSSSWIRNPEVGNYLIQLRRDHSLWLSNLPSSPFSLWNLVKCGSLFEH